MIHFHSQRHCIINSINAHIVNQGPKSTFFITSQNGYVSLTSQTHTQQWVKVASKFYFLTAKLDFQQHLAGLRVSV